MAITIDYLSLRFDSFKYGIFFDVKISVRNEVEKLEKKIERSKRNSDTNE